MQVSDELLQRLWIRQTLEATPAHWQTCKGFQNHAWQTLHPVQITAICRIFCTSTKNFLASKCQIVRVNLGTTLFAKWPIAFWRIQCFGFRAQLT